MTSGTAQSQIEELEKLRSQTRWWRLGATIASLAVVVVSAVTIHGSFKALLTQGPTQDKFISQLNEGLQADIVPMLHEMAGTALTELKPEVNNAFQKVNTRVPEVTQATMKELETFQKNMPDRAQKCLDASFDKVLKSKEQSIKTMFPEATDEQVQALITNLSASAKNEVGVANQQLFAKHQAELQTIIANMRAIQKAEASHIKNVDPTWDMGLLVLDVFRADLEELRPDKAAVAGNAKTHKEEGK
jgi:hypothetical protein